MSITDVTTSGQRHTRPGREATVTGPKGDGGTDDSRRSLDAEGGRTTGAPSPERRRNRTEEEFRSYYGLPILNEPVWERSDIAGYFFLGGLAGASSALAAGASLTGRPVLARAAKITAAGGAGLSLAALVHDLGRPERFLNMLRVFKVTSPMSVGSWLLAAYAPATVLSAFSAVTGRTRRLGTLGTFAATLLGPAVASYTGALVSNTAVPAWHDGHREMPLLFAASGGSAAGGVGMITAPMREAGPARRMALLGGAVELTLAKSMERRMGMVGETYHTGKAGRLMRLAEGLGVAGLVGSATVARRSRLGAAVSGVALVAASALTRFGIFEAGLESVRDPKYTVTPQRERLGKTGRSDQR